MATLDSYTGLITAYHSTRPKFRATIEITLKPLVDLQNFLADMPRQFDVDEAVGVQLDKVGEWIGRSRVLSYALPRLYFTFDDTIERGWDSGLWWDGTPMRTEYGIYSLDDFHYRGLLKAKIAANNWDGSIAGAAAAYEAFLGSGGTWAYIEDHQNMTMTVGISGQIPSLVYISLIAGGYVPLKPSGVAMDFVVTSANGPIFGFDVDNKYIGGWDHGAWSVTPDYFLDHGSVNETP